MKLSSARIMIIQRIGNVVVSPTCSCSNTPLLSIPLQQYILRALIVHYLGSKNKKQLKGITIVMTAALWALITMMAQGSIVVNSVVGEQLYK